MDRYTIHKFLGNGAYGAAFLVTEKATGHQFVIKVSFYNNSYIIFCTI